MTIGEEEMEASVHVRLHRNEGSGYPVQKTRTERFRRSENNWLALLNT